MEGGVVFVAFLTLLSLSDGSPQWFSQFQDISSTVRDNNQIDAILDKSDMILPIVWNTYVGNMMMDTLSQIAKGGVASPYMPPPDIPPPQPEFLFIYNTNLTVDKPFTVQTAVLPKSEANVEFRVHFAPPDGERVNFEKGDVFFAMHMMWHYNDTASRIISFNDRYNGEWSQPATLVEDKWPDIQVGERFLISVSKMGRCFATIIILGRDMHMNAPNGMEPLIFCPNVEVTTDPRKLWITVNEDNQGAKQVDVHWETWIPL